MTEPDSTRQITLADVNTNGCPHEKPRMGSGRPRAKCFFCQPHGKPPKRIVQCSCCGKVFMFNRGEHRGGRRGFWYCSEKCFSFAPSQNHRVKDLARLGTLYPTPRRCKNCGAYFSPARSRRPDIAFCSKDCCEEHRHKNDRRYLTGRKGNCVSCGEKKLLEHGVHGKPKSVCADCHNSKQEKERREIEERKERERFERAVASAIRRHEDRENSRAARAERKRLKELERQKAMLTRKCKSCGGLLLPFIKASEDKIPTVCPPCAEANAKRGKAIRRSARKAKQREVSVEKVDPILVFERDGWRCHICGVQTDKAKRGTYEDDAPELDHITTLSEGGEHSYRNTACACRSCNLQKGGKSFGQMHLGLL